MSILIKGMEMLKDGVYWCEIGVADDIAMITIHGEDRKSFPLVPIPPHGDLIDRDALKKKRHWTDDFYETEYVEVEDIDAAPTVIEAEEGE